MNNFQTPNTKIEDEANEWFMLITSGEATDSDIEAFDVWYNQDPLHHQAYVKTSQIWNELGILERTPQGESLRQSVANLTEEDHFLKRLSSWIGQSFKAPQYAFASAIAVIGLVYYLQMPLSHEAEIYQTTTSEVKEIHLADNSIITLGAMSRVEVVYETNKRSVQLIEGQAFFDVARNSQRPFYVSANGTEVRVLGTQFDVHLGQKSMTVGVLEGKVRVTPERDRLNPSSSKILTAGQMVSASPSGVMNNIRTAQIKPGDWRNGRLTYKDEVFAEVIADVNRYYSRHIVLEDDNLANIYVTTSFDVKQIDVFLKSLPEMFDVEVVYLSSGDVIIRELKNSMPIHQSASLR